MVYRAFLALGDFLRENGVPKEIMERAEVENHFFTQPNIERAVAAICAQMLTSEAIESWVKQGALKHPRVAVIMAGNIPLVGFFDMMCCAIVGAHTFIKPSSKDRVLMEWIVSKLQAFGCENISYWQDDIEVDAVIATGSNNANRYFELKFGHLPSIRRGSRSAVAVLQGNETKDEVASLWHDIFDYYGLGCRNVSHLFIPMGYDVESMLKILTEKRLDNKHYLNAYRQNRALKIMNGETFFDGGFFVATLSSSLTPPLGEITYSYFNETVLLENKDLLQCVVGRDYIAFGGSQTPSLHDWADDVNLFDFLLSRENKD